jgi:MFS family permease
MTTSGPARDAAAAGIARVFVPFACGYYLSYLYRTVNAVISPDLVRDLGVDANALGLLTSAYFLAFGVFQLPLGVLLDRLGPRRVNAGLLSIAGLGAIIFAQSDTFAGLVLGRALIGLGVSAALMASMKAFTLWFPLSRLASLNGYLMAIGGLGALSASAPVEAALRFTDWRGVFDVLAGCTFIAAGGIMLVVPERASAATGPGGAEMLRGIVRVYRDAAFWRVAGVCMTVQAGFLAVQGLWVAPWLRDVAGLSRDAVANYLLLMAVAMTAGYAFFGAAADRFESSGWGAARLFIVGTAISSGGLVLVAAGVTTGALAIWLAINFASPASALSYAMLSRRFPSELVGRATTALNFLVFAGAFATQWGLGAIISMWSAQDGHYPLAAYRAALGTFLVFQAAALAWFAAGRRRTRVAA